MNIINIYTYLYKMNEKLKSVKYLYFVQQNHLKIFHLPFPSGQLIF